VDAVALVAAQAEAIKLRHKLRQHRVQRIC
jgi:hypothetical protein